MDKFIVRVLKTIDKYKLIAHGQTVLAAVSGGYDSICMLSALAEIRQIRGLDIAVMHVNHGLRDTAADDAEYVKSLADRYGMNFHLKNADVSGYAEKMHISVETAGREIRYAFFAETAKKYNNCVIATAHNANDSVESFFMHLMRGSGLDGLTGIAAKRDNIIRPLIEISRCDIEAYCNNSGLVPAVDITNESDDYTRNDIRHNVVPCVLSRCSIDSLLRTMEIIREDNFVCENCVKTVAKNCVMDYNGISKIKIKEFNLLGVGVKRRLLHSLIDNAGLEHIDAIIQIAERGIGGSEVLLPGKRKIKISKGMLEFYE